MYQNEKIGIGITTYNRKYSYRRLFDEVIENIDVDAIVTVKNKEIDYQENDPLKLADNVKSFVYEVKEDLGVGYCKNLCLKKLLSEKCDHLFLIEDDINIKNNDVFKTYIETAKSYNLEHLNFCGAWDSITKKWLQPSYSLKNANGLMLSIYERLCGDFQYFTSNALMQIGLFDAVHYVNAMEHAEHTYRAAAAELTTPFYAFADIHKSTDFIEDTGIQSSIHHDKESELLYRKRISDACCHFSKTYGRSIGQIQHPTAVDVQKFLLAKEHCK